MTIYELLKLLEREVEVEWYQYLTSDAIIHLPNKWKISVITGYGRYCSGRDGFDGVGRQYHLPLDQQQPPEFWMRDNCEVAIFDENNEWFVCRNKTGWTAEDGEYFPPDKSDVWGWIDAERLAALVDRVATDPYGPCICPNCHRHVPIDVEAEIDALLAGVPLALEG